MESTLVDGTLPDSDGEAKFNGAECIEKPPDIAERPGQPVQRDSRRGSASAKEIRLPIRLDELQQPNQHALSPGQRVIPIQKSGSRDDGEE